MANNRLYLVDTETGERQVLFKSGGEGWYVSADTDEIERWLTGRDIPCAVAGVVYAATATPGETAPRVLPTRLQLRTEYEE